MGTVSMVWQLSCAALAKVVPESPSSDWRTKPTPRSPADIEKLGNALAGEAIRVVTREVSDPETRKVVWRVGEYGDDSGPPPTAGFAARLLYGAYAGVSKPILQTMIWQDTYPTFASRDYGLVMNQARTAQLVWLVDSVSATTVASSFRSLEVRRPGDFALLALISHEMAHLAISAASLSERYPESIVECAADIIAGFQTAAIAPRISSRGQFELDVNGGIDALGTTVIPGDWVSRDVHPDNEQRSACLRRGIGMFSEQRDRGPIGGSFLLTSERDSLIDALSLGQISLVNAALAETRTILSIPGTPQPKQSSELEYTNNPSAKMLLALNDSILKRFAAGTLSTVVGQRIAVGVSLFPGAEFNELLIRVDPPWKCAVIAGNADIGRSIGCYVITRERDVMWARFGVDRTLQSDSLRLGFRVLSVGPSTTSSSSLHLRQWLFVNGDKQAVVSIYDEPYTPNPYSDQRTGLRVFWFSFSDLRVVPKGRARN